VRFLIYLLGPDATLADALLAAVDVAVVAYLCYRVLLLIQGTRAVAILSGLLLVGVAYLGAEWAGLLTLSWILGHFLSYSFIFGVIVLFLPDIRRALAELGRSSRSLTAFVHGGRDARLEAVDAVVRAAVDLARRRVGALMVLERTATLTDLADSGLRLDAAVTPELLVCLFQPSGPIHDGAVIVQGNRLTAAGCLLPLTTAAAAAELGTRHRAALGLAEEVDAAVVVVSEERGEISVALDGVLHRHLDESRLRSLLSGVFVISRARGSRLVEARRAVATAERGPHVASRLPLQLLALAVSLSLFLLVRGERRIALSYPVTCELQLPSGFTPAAPLPAEVTVSLSGPWSRLRSLDPASLGPIRVDLSRARAGPASWSVRPDAVHVPRGVRVDSVFPAQGTVDLRPVASESPAEPR